MIKTRKIQDAPKVGKISRKQAKAAVKKVFHKVVQIRNPKTDRYIKIDVTKGVILKIKNTAGPFKGVEIVKVPKKK